MFSGSSPNSGREVLPASTKRRRLRRCFALVILALVACLARPSEAQRCATGCQLIDYQSTITDDANGPLDLKAFAFYPRDLAVGDSAPLAVVMHGYSPSSTFGQFRPHAERLANEGFVAVLVAMRGRDGSDGIRDSGGLEIYDIYDAVEHIKSSPFFEDRIDPTNVHITGYSGGGGNVMSALTKFPDYFRVGSSHFGMSDYGFDPADGWYVRGANVGATRTNQLDADVGNPVAAQQPGGDPKVLDRYQARASNLASKNNPYSEIHLFVNTDETISPPINNTSYRDNAAAAATTPGEFDNITVHLGESDGSVWIDRNNDGEQQDEEIQSFPHGDSLGSQRRGEAWYLDRLRQGAIPEPQLNGSDELFVAGWVRTKRFELFLGDGQDAAGTLTYELEDQALSFQLAIESSDRSVVGRLTLPAGAVPAERFSVELNGEIVGSSDSSNAFTYPNLGDGDHLRLVAIPEPPSVAASLAAASALIARRWMR